MVRRFLISVQNMFSRWNPADPGKILPYSIRRALGDHYGILYPDDLRILAQTDAYVDILFYLLTKILRHVPDDQYDFLSEAGRHMTDDDHHALMDLIRRKIDGCSPHVGVEAMKLLQINRQGFELWDDLYRGAAERCAAEGRDIVLVAYAPLVGFQNIVRIYRDTALAVSVISHLRVADAADTFCGNRFVWGPNGACMTTLVRKDAVWPSRLVVLEDTIRRGTTLRAVTDFIRSRSPHTEIQEVVLVKTE